MLIVSRTAQMVAGALVCGATLGATPYRATPHRDSRLDASSRILMIRVSQETGVGVGDFDSHILGFVRALQTTGKASDFYQYNKGTNPNYGNPQPVLTPNTSHIFFVNAVDGLALFVVHNTSNRAETGNGGTANTQWQLSGGLAKVLLSDDIGEAVNVDGGTLFTGTMNWSQNNTDGMVIGALPVGFTILGQFTAPPTGLSEGWEVISADGSKVPLSLVPGRRVRLDVNLAVRVRQDQ